MYQPRLSFSHSKTLSQKASSYHAISVTKLKRNESYYQARNHTLQVHLAGQLDCLSCRLHFVIRTAVKLTPGKIHHEAVVTYGLFEYFSTNKLVYLFKNCLDATFTLVVSGDTEAHYTQSIVWFSGFGYDDCI